MRRRPVRNSAWLRRSAGSGALPGAVLLLVLVLPLGGCAGHAAAPRSAAGPSPVGQTGERPWQIPAADLGTQRLFRAQYSGPEGNGGIKVTLRLASPERYRVAVADTLGRNLWSLAVEGGEGLWLDFRGERYCRVRGRLDLDLLPLSPFPLSSLPTLLLGRIPALPAGEPVVEGETMTYRDEEGRRWQASLGPEGPLRWTLWDGEQPAVWWQRGAAESILSQRRDGIQIRWRQLVQETLAELPPVPALPDGYRAACADGI